MDNTNTSTPAASAPSMGLYKEFASGPVKKTFDLTLENIGEYKQQCEEMCAELQWINSLLNLEAKLAHAGTIKDTLFTEEYIRSRLAKVNAARKHTELTEVYRRVRADLVKVNEEIEKVKPLVFSKNSADYPEAHEQMSILDARRVALEHEINDACAQKYGKIRDHLPKIYYMIVEDSGSDRTRETIRMCFIKMQHVLSGELTTEEAAGHLMDDSSQRYGMKKELWDPIRIRTKKGKGGRSKK